MKAIGAVIRNCKHLSGFKVEDGDNSICHLLEHVRNPSKCSLTIDDNFIVSDTAVQLASLLPRFINVTTLNLHLMGFCAATFDTLVTSITYKTLEKLILRGIILTPAGTKALGRSLLEMSSLQELQLTGGCILQAEEMEALFGGVNKLMPLRELTFSGFKVRGCLAPLIKSLPFFPNLRKLRLDMSNIDRHDQCSLLKSFGFLTELEVCPHGENSSDYFVYRTSVDGKILSLCVKSLTQAIGAMMALPELSSLKRLSLFTSYGNILQDGEMEALFGGFNKTMPLQELAFTDFSVRGRLAALFRSLRFFPNLVTLKLQNLSMDEHDLHGLLESFQFIPNLRKLNLSRNPLGHAVTSIAPHVINLKKLRNLRIDNSGLSEKDLNYVRDIVQQALPELVITADITVGKF